MISISSKGGWQVDGDVANYVDGAHGFFVSYTVHQKIHGPGIRIIETDVATEFGFQYSGLVFVTTNQGPGVNQG